MDVQTFPHFLSVDECATFQQLIKTVNATNFTDSGAFTNKKWVDQALATLLYERLQEVDPSSRYLCANKLIMAGMYVPGNSFGLHTDTGLYYNRVNRTKSRWTLLIYLNDGFEGGETVFYDTETMRETHRIVPEVGKALLFDIDLWHSGAPLLSGEKHWIGCEIIGTF